MSQGFTTLDAIALKGDVMQWCKDISITLRRQPGRQSFEMTDQLQKILGHIALWAKHTYMTDRDQDHHMVNTDEVDAVAAWALSLDLEESPPFPTKFKDPSNMRHLQDEIRNYLGRKKGPSGLPLLYVIRTRDDPPNPDKGFGNENLFEFE